MRSRVQALINSGAFGPDHAATNLDLNDPIVPALEYFLSLDSVSGFKDKLENLKTKPAGRANKNDRRVQWASLCAELGAICLLGKTLNLAIVGFDKVSPKAARNRADCDVVAVLNGALTFFEVKRNSAQDKQVLPDLLEERLYELNLLFDITPELVDRNYDCSDIEEKLTCLQQHVNNFKREIANGILTNEDVPLPFEAGGFIVYFHRKSESGAGGRFFTPVSTDDLSKWLLGPGEEGRDGNPMEPMVKQAISKGADYLVCRVPSWDKMGTIVEKCFDGLLYRNGITYFVEDERMGPLTGIILFSRYDNFCVINNPNSTTSNFIVYKDA